MSLGTELAADIYEAIKPTDEITDFPAAMATAINNYLGGAEYADGALTYSFSATPSLFTLPAVGTAASAAAIIGLGVMSYWLPAGTAPGIPGVATDLDVVVAGVIIATTVGPAVTAALTAIFSDLAGGQYWVNEEIADHTTIANGTEEDDQFLTYYDDNPSVIVNNTTEKKWYGRNGNAWAEVTDTKWHQMAEAIESAVGDITTTWTEITPPAPAAPYTGGIE